MLNSDKNRLYDKVYAMKAEVQESETIQKCVEQAIQADPTKVQDKCNLYLSVHLS